MALKIKKGDKVRIIAGALKGEDAVVESIQFKKDKTLVALEGKTRVKHQKRAEGKGEKINIPKLFDISNLMLIDPVSKKPSRVGFNQVDKKKLRVAKQSGENIKE